ncbi:MAG: hypothetical protein H0V24_00640, partial [Chloroflexia bacterium]|nr:hypothetical protein [Chloroflexia bacterium]
MPPEPPPAPPFPPRATETYRADSVAEEHAFFRAYPPPDGEWEIVSQTLRLRHNAPQDHITVRAASLGEITVPFDIASFFGAAPGAGAAAVDFDRLLETALAFARDNGPHHPGSLPRFPVPSAGYPGRVEVPLPLVALDNAGRRGLYAPPRVVVLSYPEGEPLGTGEYPGFDPKRWPPRRLGNWPPPASRLLSPPRLQATITRFTACWHRLLTAW